MALARSYSPPSIFFVSAASISRLEFAEATREIRADILPIVRPLDQHAQIVGAPAQRLPQRLIFLQAPAALHHLLCVRLIAPKIRFANPLLEVGELFVQSGTLKRCLRSSVARRARSSYCRTRCSSSTATIPLLWAGLKARPPC